MDLSIIIVSWNVKDLLDRCLASIKKDATKPATEVIVVDNHSVDGTADLIRSQHPGVHLIELPTNRGFAAANNVALARAKGRYVFFLNPDTEVQPGTLSGLVSYLDAHVAIAMVAPQIVNEDGSYQKGQVRSNPRLVPELLTILKLNHLLPSLKWFRSYYRSDFDPSTEQEVDQIMGAAMFVRRSALDRIGTFDERFFLWFEEVDLCLRFRRAEEHIKYVPEFRVVHLGGRSFRKRQPLDRQRIHNRSRILFFEKHHGKMQALVLRIVSPLGLIASFFYQVTGHGR